MNTDEINKGQYLAQTTGGSTQPFLTESGMDFSGSLPELSHAQMNAAMGYAQAMLETMVDYKELLMRYTCAIKEINTKFEVLNTEFNTRYQRNPISGIHSRLKSTNSILEKLSRRNLGFSLGVIEENINDIAGIRVICAFEDDIYQLADALTRQDDITLLQKKDYIASPKPNGYRSLHLIVSVPVFFADQRRNMKVEVQIRTIAMDFWASLEHQMKYKQEIADQEQMYARLKACAETIAKTDAEMLSIRRQIEADKNKPTQEA